MNVKKYRPLTDCEVLLRVTYGNVVTFHEIAHYNAATKHFTQLGIPIERTWKHAESVYYMKTDCLCDGAEYFN